MDYIDFYITNEFAEAEFELPVDNGDVFILGKKYDPKQELELIKADIRSKIWCTYRRGFVPLGSPQLTSDKGWGCMLRCGQMVLAQALVHLHLGRDWVWTRETRDPTYLKIVEKFEDNKSSPYSIHLIAQMGVSEDKKVGEWFGPNTIAQVLKKLVPYDSWSSLKIHVALDNIIATDEIIELCDTSPLWTPLLLIVPLRLGLGEINSIYFDSLKKCFEISGSCGMIGGRPNQALYFIGYVGDEALFLDPHTAQRTGSVGTKSTPEEIEMDDTFHQKLANRINFKDMDPSLAVCFLCRNREEFDELIVRFQTDLPRSPALFEVAKERPSEWISPSSSVDQGELLFPDASIVFSDCCNEEFENVEPNSSDDEFEIIA